MAASSFLGQILNQFGTGDDMRDYQHASRTFVNDLYRLSPKFSSLYHVFVEFNNTITQHDTAATIELGLLAKSITLPKFSIQTKTYNAYNRKNVSQERINYDPVTIMFHDDSADVVRNFWYGYYSYYYRDSDNTEQTYQSDYKYVQQPSQNWGYTPAGNSSAANYINSIRIYSLHQKSFSSYILLRPTITSFQHGQHTSGNYELMEHQMTFAYEGILYEFGPVSNGTVMGFDQIHYDNTPSPLTPVGGGTTSILGPGGAVQTAGSIVTNLQNGNFGAAALSALHGYNNFKNTNFKTVATAELAQIGMNILKGQNTQSTIFVPTAGSIQSGISKATSGFPGSTIPTGAILNINSQNLQLPSAADSGKPTL